MQIVDTYNEIRQCFPDKRFDLSSWKKYAQEISPYLIDKVEKNIEKYDYEKDILPIMQSLIQKEDKLFLAHNSFVRVTNNISDKIKEKLDIELNVSIIFYLGLCNGAGWATTLGENSAILLGVEKIVELSWYDRQNMIALIYHELGHIWHFQVRNAKTNIETLKDKSLWQLYTEGMAMYVEQLLCEDDRFYHQDTNGWLDWCNENRSLLYKEFIGRIDKKEGVQQFFGDWNSFQGKSDTGYYLGCELIRSLSKEYSLLELACMDISVIESKVRAIR